MPRPTTTAFRAGRRSHRGRPGRRNRSRFRVHFAGRCSVFRASSESPVSAATRSRRRRARAASARASAFATSSSGSTSEMGSKAAGSTPGRVGSIASAESSPWSAFGPSGSCTERQLITGTWAQRRHRAAAFVALTCGNARSPGNGAGRRSGSPGADCGVVQVIFSNQENFLFRCGRVIGCDPSWPWLPRCSAPVC